MKKIIALAMGAFLFAIAGCSTTSQPKGNQYTGITEIELVRQMGTPHRHYSVGDSRFLTYEFQERKVLQGVHTTSLIGLPPLMTGAPNRVVHRYCVTTFEVNGGTVVDWKADGNACPIN